MLLSQSDLATILAAFRKRHLSLAHRDNARRYLQAGRYLKGHRADPRDSSGK